MKRKGRSLPPTSRQGLGLKKKRAPDVTQEDLSSGVRWWEERPSDDPGAIGVTPKVYDVVRTIVNDTGSLRRTSLLTWWRMYQNFESRGLSALSYFRPRFDIPSRFKLNIVKSAIDTLHARIVAVEPRVTHMTMGGEWSEQKKAKALDRLVSGVMYENKFSKTIARPVNKDALIFGAGANQVFENDEGRCAMERIPLEEIIIDDLEAFYGKPRSIYRTKMFNRDELLAKFKGNPAAQKIIRTAPIARTSADFADFAERANLVTVIEAWHLPSGPVDEFTAEQKTQIADARGRIRAARKAEPPDLAEVKRATDEIDAIEREGNDGIHMIVTENGILHAGSWRKRWFPIVFRHRTPPQRGFLTSVGIPEELAGIQYEINKALLTISKCIPWCVPKLFVDRAAGIVQEHLDSLVMGIIEYNSNSKPPEMVAWNNFPVHLVDAIERWMRQALEILGLSQMSAQSRKPADLESGEALRTFDNIEGGRHFEEAKTFEEFYVDNAELIIRVVREIAERNGGKYPVKSVRRKRLFPVDWSEIGLPDDAFVIQAFPVSNLPRTPEGRLDMVYDLMKIGFLDKEDAIRLLALPDLDAVNELMEAAADFLHWQLEEIIEHGRPQLAEPYMNLRYALDHAQAAYLSMRTMKLEEPRLQMLRDYIQSIQELIAATTQPAPLPGEQPGVPGGPPTLPAPGEPMVAPTATGGGAPMPAASAMGAPV